jgi:peptide/nickel transport system substrate-binding protein
MMTVAGTEPSDRNKIRQDLVAARYKGETVVVPVASITPTIYAEAQVGIDVIQRIGMNIDLQNMEWGSVAARRANRARIDKGGWNVFYTELGGMGNISPGPDIAVRTSRGDSWFGWPIDPKMENTA